MKHPEVHPRAVGELTDGEASAPGFRQQLTRSGNEQLVDVAAGSGHGLFIQTYNYTVK
jgi:hypothetical protein